MAEQNWSNQTAEQLAKLSDQRLNEILKRARIHNSRSMRKCRDAIYDAVEKDASFDELHETVNNALNAAKPDADYFAKVKAECSKRPHFESKGE